MQLQGTAAIDCLQKSWQVSLAVPTIQSQTMADPTLTFTQSRHTTLGTWDIVGGIMYSIWRGRFGERCCFLILDGDWCVEVGGHHLKVRLPV